MANTVGAAVLQKQFESVLGGNLDWQSRPVPELVRTGVSEVDTATGGLPRGCLTEIIGPASSGRTSLLIAILAEATSRDEVCALVDAEDSFDPASAAAAGVRLERLLWVRSAHNAEHALKAADLLIQGGGFGLVAMDLGDTPPETARRISLTSWFRLRRAVEHTPTVLVTLARQSNAKTCASLILECKRERIAWSGAPAQSLPPAAPGPRPLALGPWPHGCLLRSIAVRVTSKNRSKVCSPVFTAVAI
jgi:recombination protein RecA